MKTNNLRKMRKSSNLTESFLTQAAGDWTVPAIIAVVTCVAFLPVLWNQFVDWDDFDNLVNNPRYRGLGWDQLRWMFTTFHMGPYQPLSWMTYGLDYLIWGIDPTGYHLTNLMLHAANAAFFYLVARRLIAVAFSMPNDEVSWHLNASAAFAALMFGIHPLRVESVAWATERRDVLSGFFFMGTIYCYLRSNSNSGDRAQSRKWLCAALVAYVLSLLAKATAMTLPMILVLLDCYPLRRLNDKFRTWWTPPQREVLREKIPFVILAIGFAIVALVGQQQASALKSLESYTIESRLAQAFYGASFYVWKTFVPLGLSPLYELSPHFSPWDPAILAGGAATIIITVGLYALRKRWPAGFACWAYSVVTLGPVLGIVSTGPQLVAERYSYLSCLSWAVLAGGVLLHMLQGAHRKVRTLAVAVAVTIVTAILAAATWRQATVWQNTSTLWNYVLRRDPNSSIAHYNLGRFLAKQGRHAEAISHYHAALAIRPDDADTHNNLGLSLAIRGETGASLEEFRKAVQVNPNYAKGFFNLGRVYARQGELEKSLDNFRQALKLSPDEAEIYLGLGNVLARQGQPDEAVATFRQAVKLNPDFAEAHIALARALAAQGKKIEAEQHYETAMRLIKSHNQTPPS